MSKKEQPIIIKRIKKGGHGGHHGGAWKVAYADFITAMMALFMVLWLVATMSMSGKKAMGQYFRSYSIIKGESSGGGGKGISFFPGEPVRLDPEPGGIKRGEVARKMLTQELSKTLEDKLSDIKDQVLVFTTNDGVRIELVDKDGSPMYELGKANFTASGHKVLDVIAEFLKTQTSNLNIEGHTDSVQYEQENYTNWELAADRANSARRELLKHGIDPAKITKITSFADKVPIKPTDTTDAINRRVSILVEMK